MPTTIYWFSGAGNSLHTARSIAAGLEDETKVVSIASVLKDKKREMPEGSRVGIVFPVHGFGPPRIVQKFIGKKLKTEGVSSVFAVATYAGCLGWTMAILQRQLARRGLTLDAAYAIKMPEIYPPLGGPQKEMKQRQILDRAEQKIKAVTDSLNCGVLDFRAKGNPLTRIISKAVNPLFLKGVGGADKGFHVDENCDGNGLCAKICPVDNIKMECGRPTWLGHCEQCFACLHWCPNEAIQFGRRSRKQPRYHHPATTLDDLQTTENGDVK